MRKLFLSLMFAIFTSVLFGASDVKNYLSDSDVDLVAGGGTTAFTLYYNGNSSYIPIALVYKSSMSLILSATNTFTLTNAACDTYGELISSINGRKDIDEGKWVATPSDYIYLQGVSYGSTASSGIAGKDYGLLGSSAPARYLGLSLSSNSANILLNSAQPTISKRYNTDNKWLYGMTLFRSTGTGSNYMIAYEGDTIYETTAQRSIRVDDGEENFTESTPIKQSDNSQVLEIRTVFSTWSKTTDLMEIHYQKGK